MRRSLSLFLFPAFVCLAASKPVDFNRDIRPILSDNCFTCHGPDDSHRMMKLRLDTKEGLFEKRGAYQIVVPGDSAKSRLYQRISAEKKAARMPPPQATTTLTDRQVALIREWIDSGAKYEPHWAYVPPHRPDLPAVKNTAWPRNPVDRFVLARLEREGLRPPPAADKITLLRRVTFDLTGLPPTPKDIDEFLADKSPDAYEKRVDRLLASPHYGERMAMQWLDLARYADSHGYHIDSHREMWHWRDWVIAAFNRNMPFDRFTVEQLAGDLLPNATLEQRLATGFNRNHMINFEGGAIPEEYQTEYVVDRVDATATVWMGMTLGCARCHDHKYDPISQKDFYRFYAFFNTIPEKGLDGKAGNAAPLLPLPTPEQAREKEDLTAAIAARKNALPEAEIAKLQTAWESTAKLPGVPSGALLAHYELDGNLADSSGHYRYARVLAGEPGFGAGQVGRAVSINRDTRVQLGEIPLGDAFTVAFWMRPNAQTASIILEHAALEIGLDDSIYIGDLKRGAHLYVRAGGKEIATADRIPLREWHHVTVTYDGANVALYLDAVPSVSVRVNPWPKTKGPKMDTDAHGYIGTAVRPYRGDLDDILFYDRPLAAHEIRGLYVDQPARAVLLDPAAKRTKEQKQALRDYFLRWLAPEPYRTAHVELSAMRKRLAALDKEIATSMVMQEMEKPRDTFVLGRGDYRNHGEKVTPGVPSALPPLPREAPRSRLGLAQWLVSPQHPLTARVAVNRYWQTYFGTGLVKTSEDFGSQGDMPLHQELLDWLATEFTRTGWDVKAMQRLIVTSATYRQSSRVTPELLERDPENRLLARGPRFRLPAESVRDNALFVSGLLDARIGGPSVFPYQPAGLWEEMAFGDVYSAQTYIQSHGPDLYRRSMYTFWKRTVPPAALSTFDAPDREKCASRRLVTNTPLQALVLLNDPTYVEAARMLAQRALREAGRNPAARLRFAFREATGRAPTSAEARILLGLEKSKLAMYRRDPGFALKLLAVGEKKPAPDVEPAELAAWTIVSSAILNLDETVTKE